MSSVVVDGDVTFDTMLLTGGTGPNGGALQLGQDTNGTLINTTVTGNTSETAAAILNNGGTLTLTNATVSTNTITADTIILGSVWNRINVSTPILNLNNSIIANTFDSGGSAIPDCRNNSGTVNFSPGQSNLIEQDQAGGVACDLAGSNTLSGDPELDSLQDNGGQSHTLALLAGSQAIGNGNNAICAASPVNGLDQRGVSRPQGSACDIGAFEFDAFGSLTIIKEAAVEDGTDFAFTSDIPGGSSFTLDDEDSQTDSITQSITFADIAVGSYVITETVTSGWQLDSATCTGGADSGSLNGETLSVVLGAGEDVTCTFTNSLQPGTISIEKVTLPADGTSYGYTQTIRSPFSFLIDGGQTETFNNVPPGSYVVVEQDHFPDVLVDLSCDDGASVVPSVTDINNAAVTINLEASETVHCVFTNSQLGTLTIIKNVVNDHGGTLSSSDFTINVSGNNPSQTSFVGSDTGVDVTLEAGAYSITENPVAGYSGSFSADCSGVIAIGESKTCTITNDDIAPTITVNKVLVPASASGVFSLTIDSVTYGVGGDGASTGAIEVVSGTHTIAELGLPGTNLANYDSQIGGDCATDGTVSVGLAENVTCILTNIGFPDLRLTKSVTPSGPLQPGQALTYTLHFTNTGSLQATGVTVTDTLPVAISNVTIISSGLAITQSSNSPCCVWQVDPMAVNAGGFITITGQVSAALSADITLFNTAKISTSDPEPETGNNQASTLSSVTVPRLTFNQASTSTPETAGPIVISVTLSPAGLAPVSVDYASSNGTASAGSDYGAVSQRLTFAPGTTLLTFTVPISDDTIDEPDETLNLTLSNPSGAAILLGSAVVTITDNDLASLTISKGSQRDLGDPTATITYTIIVQNNGGSDAVGAVVSDTIPAQVSGAVWSCTASAGADCITPNGSGNIQQSVNLNAGSSLTYVVVANIPYQATAVNTATVIAPDGLTLLDTTANTSRLTQLFLPLIVKGFAPGPDLVVDELVATTNAVTVTIRNAGNTSVVDAFWVDLYVNPSKVPGLNEPWNTIASQGVAWGLGGGNLPLNPGDTRVLTVANAVPGLTSPPPYPAGVTVYAQVDAINFTTSYGAVQEIDENNNLAQSTVTAATSSGAFAQPTTTGQSPALDGLPPRR